MPANGNLLVDITASGVPPAGCFVYFGTTGYDNSLRDGSTVTGHVDSGGVSIGYGLLTEFD